MATPATFVELSVTVSTNADALRLARAGEPLPLWVRAERQTGGRGRVGRAWLSLDGNLMASVAVRSHAPLSQAGELALVAGLALYDGVADAVIKPLPMRLKWPNDLLIDEAKAGGILVETANDKDGFLAVIGFGLNVAAHPSDAGQPVTSLAAQGVQSTASEMAQRLTIAFATHLSAWDDGRGFQSVTRGAWQERAGAFGERVSVTLETGRLTGTYQGLNEQGHIVLHTDDKRVVTVSHGDVTLAGMAKESD
jgi:BirA family transcriptional regulator, biotin operon repressor / biotin---[acetyl-CoA-carboxylase] ligase